MVALPPPPPQRQHQPPLVVAKSASTPMSGAISGPLRITAMWNIRLIREILHIRGMGRAEELT